MKKEKLNLGNVKRDLQKVISHQDTVKSDWRLSFIVPALLGSLTLCLWLGTLLPALIGIPLAAYHIVRYTSEMKVIRAKKTALREAVDRGDIYVSRETLSHIVRESIYEPRTVGGNSRALKEAKFYHFESGRCWRDTLIISEAIQGDHYEWSSEFKLSSKGLDNTSVKGNEFYFVTLQACCDISYIYPCKYFELGDDLKGKE